MPACVRAALSFPSSVIVSLIAHSAGLISLPMLHASRLINTHLWQTSTASCERHTASWCYSIISAWCSHSAQCFICVCPSVSPQLTKPRCVWFPLRKIKESIAHVLVPSNRLYAASELQTMLGRSVFKADGADWSHIDKYTGQSKADCLVTVDQTHRGAHTHAVTADGTLLWWLEVVSKEMI